MIEKRIIEWLDLGDSVQKMEIFERPKLLLFFKYNYLLLKHGINSEIADIIFILLFFLQIISLSTINIDPNKDLILEIFKYLENIILPDTIISNKKSYTIASIILWGLNFAHILLMILIFCFLQKRIKINILFFLLSILNYIFYYYLIGPTFSLALSGTLCSNKKHTLFNVECYKNSWHLYTTILNFIFAFYELITVEIFSLYNNKIGTVYGSDIKSRVHCDYDIYSANAKLVVYIIMYFYKKYAQTSNLFKYIYQVYIFLSCLFLSIYTIKKVFYYNKKINIIIHYSWFFDTWFALCILLKICFKITDSTLLILLGWILISIVFFNQSTYSYYKIISQLDLTNEQSLVSVEKFNNELIKIFNSDKKNDKMLLVGIIKKYEDYISSNPELKDVYDKLMKNPFLNKKFVGLNELPILSIIYTIYTFYLEKSEIRNDISLQMCYFLVKRLKNPTFAIFLLFKLKTNNHSQLYHKYMLIEEIKEYLIAKLLKNSSQNSINHVQIGSVILYYQYLELFKVKIYDATSNQIEYFDLLRNSVTSGKIAENFLKIGEDILRVKNEIVRLYEKIIELNPFSNESENDYMLYLKTILQDDIMAKNEEKKFNLLKSNKFNEKNNLYHSMFKNDINSVVLIDGYSFNGKILYATPNFPFLYKFNGKEIINTQIEEILPNFIQPFHKDLIENCMRYSNITDAYNNSVNAFLKGKNNTLYNINAYVKPVPI